MVAHTTTKNMLEIFCGTKSVGKVAEPRGYNVYSIDNRSSTKPTWCGDLLTWKGYKASDFPVPDFIWASPPCTTFSNASGGFYRKLDKKTGQLVTQKGKEEGAKIGEDLLKKTLKIIKYFQKRNPNLKWCFENPRGQMRHHELVKGLNRQTCCYCKYRHPFMKPTDLWSNFPLELKMCKNIQKGAKDHCHHERTPGKKNRGKAKRSGVLGTSSMNARYAIPPKLIEYILDTAEAHTAKERADMASKTETKNMPTSVPRAPPPYEEEEKIDYKALYEEQVRINDDLNRLYRQAEDELAELKAEDKPKPKPEDKQKPITAKDVRAWCRDKYGGDWWKEQKAERKK